MWLASIRGLRKWAQNVKTQHTFWIQKCYFRSYHFILKLFWREDFHFADFQRKIQRITVNSIKFSSGSILTEMLSIQISEISFKMMRIRKTDYIRKESDIATVSSERNSIFIHEYIFTNLIQNSKYVYCKYDRNECIVTQNHHRYSIQYCTVP